MGATATVDELKDARKSKFARIEELFGKYENPEQMAKEDRAEVKSLYQEVDKLDFDIQDLSEGRSLAQEYAARKKRDAEIVNPMRFPGGGQPESRGDAAVAGKSLDFGNDFLENPAVKSWYEQVAPSGKQISKEVPVKSPRVWFEGVGFKTLVTGAGSTSGGPLVNIDYRGLPDPMGVYQRMLRLRDLVTVLRTASDTVEYARIGTPTNAAAPVAEATNLSAGAKPESAFPMSSITDTIKNIAHWIPVTRRAFADAPQLRDLINSFLRYGLMEEVEDQMVTGDGTGENFTGVLNTSGILTQAFTTDILTTTRKARTKLLLQGRVQPSAWVMNPNDWETIDLLQDNEARYYFGGPSALGTPRLWGVPVIELEGMTASHAVLADWRYAVLWDREETQLYVTDSHSDLFIRNILVLLAELRAGFGIIRPAAFIDADLTA